MAESVAFLSAAFFCGEHEAFPTSDMPLLVP